MPQSGARDLSGRVVLVTGAGRGLGRALVVALLDAGARVAGCARSADDLAALESTHADASDRLLLRNVDVADADAMVRLAAQIDARWSRIDGLVLNASVLDERVPLRDVDPAEWRRVLDVNLTGAFNACRAVLPSMRRARGGSIIAVSSGVGDRPRRDWGAYAVSKRALEAFALNLALEESDAGVRVNVVDPGAMRTDMRRGAYPDEDPATLPDPSQNVGVYLCLLDSAIDVTGRRFVARDWRATNA